MGEIDDLYQQEAEAIDLKFLEEIKSSKDHEKSIAKYLTDLRRAREKFEKLYGKFNANESKRIARMKKKIEKMPKFKHLEIEHFDFEHGFWSRRKMAWNVWSFNFMRKFHRFFSWLFPNWLVYTWFKVKIFLKHLWNDFVEIRENVWAWIKRSSVSLASKTWVLLKNIFARILKIGRKLLFWKKRVKEEVKDGAGEKKEGDETKTEEKKD